MRFFAYLLLAMIQLFCVPPASAQSLNTERPQEIRNSTPQQKARRPDPVQLQADAKELATLSASIPADIDRANKGMLPKDVADKLKRIEQLSKRLRTQLTQY